MTYSTQSQTVSKQAYTSWLTQISLLLTSVLFLKPFLSSVRRWESALSVKEWQGFLVNQTQYLINHSCLGPLMWVPTASPISESSSVSYWIMRVQQFKFIFVYKLHIIKKIWGCVPYAMFTKINAIATFKETFSVKCSLAS